MNDFTSVYPETVRLDPNKRVKYVHGLVLGVDEFLQEELYLLEKHRLHNRSLHGYGTVCGLWVDKEDTANGPLIKVGAGIAVNPKGQEIRVPLDQCALLNEWLAHHRAEAEGAIGSPPGLLPLYLVLCYRECETDRVPIPSGPCQSLEETSAPSRIADDFSLKFKTSKPQHTEDDIIRKLFELLSQIEITDTSPGLSRKDLEDLVRGLALPTSPPVASPPGADLTLHPDNAREYLRSAFKVWVTEVRPRLLENDRNCASGPPEEDCVLLARLNCDVALTEVGYRVSGNVELEESGRPYLLSTRLLQEHFLTRFASEDALSLGAVQQQFVGGVAGPYRIVAAGRFDNRGDQVGPVYNGLEAVEVFGESTGTFALHFNDYENPDSGSPGNQSYIVRGTVEGDTVGTFQVVRYENDRIIIRSTSIPTSPRPRPLEALGFMVEISEIIED